MQIYDLNPRLHDNAYFFEWLMFNYVDSETVGIRRHADRDERSASMLAFLRDLESNAKDVTRAWFITGLTGMQLSNAHRDFDTFAPNGAPHVDPACVWWDYERLLQVTGPLRAFVNKRVAHLDPRGAEAQATYGQLDTALDYLLLLVRRYYLLLNQGGFDPNVVNLMPWKEIFLKTPWKIP